MDKQKWEDLDIVDKTAFRDFSMNLTTARTIRSALDFYGEFLRSHGDIEQDPNELKVVEYLLSRLPYGGCIRGDHTWSQGYTGKDQPLQEPAEDGWLFLYADVSEGETAEWRAQFDHRRTQYRWCHICNFNQSRDGATGEVHDLTH